MRPRHVIASLFHLFTVFFFFAAGSFFMALPYLPEVRLQLAHFLMNHFELCTPCAEGFFLIALLLFFGFFGLDRGKVLRIEMGKHSTSVDSSVIQQTLEECFKTRFPKLVSLSDVAVISAKKLEIGIRLTPLEEGIREELFIQVEGELQTLLRERFGYSRPFHLIVKSMD